MPVANPGRQHGASYAATYLPKLIPHKRPDNVAIANKCNGNGTFFRRDVRLARSSEESETRSAMTAWRAWAMERVVPQRTVLCVRCRHEGHDEKRPGVAPMTSDNSLLNMEIAWKSAGVRGADAARGGAQGWRKNKTGDPLWVARFRLVSVWYRAGWQPAVVRRSVRRVVATACRSVPPARRRPGRTPGGRAARAPGTIPRRPDR